MNGHGRDARIEDTPVGSADARRWPRPVPLIGDRTSSAERGADPRGWAFDPDERRALYDVVGARRDIRRFRHDPVPPEIVGRMLGAAHAAPSVGHSQPWRFILVRDPATRDRAAVMADRERHRQAAAMDEGSSAQMLDLQLEGVREAPLGVVVCCDRRAPAQGVLGRATYVDADLWSCACAIENLWLAARAEGLGVGWVTLFRPDDLARLLGLPEGVETLGWLCVGWPDERPPDPGLARAGLVDAPAGRGGRAPRAVADGRAAPSGVEGQEPRARGHRGHPRPRRPAADAARLARRARPCRRSSPCAGHRPRGAGPVRPRRGRPSGHRSPGVDLRRRGDPGRPGRHRRRALARRHPGLGRRCRCPGRRCRGAWPTRPGRPPAPTGGRSEAIWWWPTPSRRTTWPSSWLWPAPSVRGSGPAWWRWARWVSGTRRWPRRWPPASWDSTPATCSGWVPVATPRRSTGSAPRSPPR